MRELRPKAASEGSAGQLLAYQRDFKWAMNPVYHSWRNGGERVAMDLRLVA